MSDPTIREEVTSSGIEQTTKDFCSSREANGSALVRNIEIRSSLVQLENPGAASAHPTHLTAHLI